MKMRLTLTVALFTASVLCVGLLAHVCEGVSLNETASGSQDCPRVDQGLPNVTQTAGESFKLIIPEDAFSGRGEIVKVSGSQDAVLGWLMVNGTAGEITGRLRDNATGMLDFQVVIRCSDCGRVCKDVSSRFYVFVEPRVGDSGRDIHSMLSVCWSRLRSRWELLSRNAQLTRLTKYFYRSMLPKDNCALHENVTDLAVVIDPKLLLSSNDILTLFSYLSENLNVDCSNFSVVSFSVFNSLYLLLNKKDRPHSSVGLMKENVVLLVHVACDIATKELVEEKFLNFLSVSHIQQKVRQWYLFDRPAVWTRLRRDVSSVVNESTTNTGSVVNGIQNKTEPLAALIVSLSPSQTLLHMTSQSLDASSSAAHPVESLRTKPIHLSGTLDEVPVSDSVVNSAILKHIPSKTSENHAHISTEPVISRSLIFDSELSSEGLNIMSSSEIDSASVENDYRSSKLLDFDNFRFVSVGTKLESHSFEKTSLLPSAVEIQPTWISSIEASVFSPRLTDLLSIRRSFLQSATPVLHTSPLAYASRSTTPSIQVTETFKTQATFQSSPLVSSSSSAEVKPSSSAEVKPSSSAEVKPSSSSAEVKPSSSAEVKPSSSSAEVKPSSSAEVKPSSSAEVKPSSSSAEVKPSSSSSSSAEVKPSSSSSSVDSLPPTIASNASSVSRLPSVLPAVNNQLHSIIPSSLQTSSLPYLSHSVKLHASPYHLASSFQSDYVHESPTLTLHHSSSPATDPTLFIIPSFSPSLFNRSSAEIFSNVVSLYLSPAHSFLNPSSTSAHSSTNVYVTAYDSALSTHDSFHPITEDSVPNSTRKSIHGSATYVNKTGFDSDHTSSYDSAHESFHEKPSDFVTRVLKSVLDTSNNSVLSANDSVGASTHNSVLPSGSGSDHTSDHGFTSVAYDLITATAYYTAHDSIYTGAQELVSGAHDSANPNIFGTIHTTSNDSAQRTMHHDSVPATTGQNPVSSANDPLHITGYQSVSSAYDSMQTRTNGFDSGTSDSLNTDNFDSDHTITSTHDFVSSTYDSLQTSGFVSYHNNAPILSSSYHSTFYKVSNTVTPTVSGHDMQTVFDKMQQNSEMKLFPSAEDSADSILSTPSLNLQSDIDLQPFTSISNKASQVSVFVNTLIEHSPPMDSRAVTSVSLTRHIETLNTKTLLPGMPSSPSQITPTSSSESAMTPDLLAPSIQGYTSFQNSQVVNTSPSISARLTPSMSLLGFVTEGSHVTASNVLRSKGLVDLLSSQYYPGTPVVQSNVLPLTTMMRETVSLSASRSPEVTIATANRRSSSHASVIHSTQDILPDLTEITSSFLMELPSHQLTKVMSEFSQKPSSQLMELTSVSLTEQALHFTQLQDVTFHLSEFEVISSLSTDLTSPHSALLTATEISSYLTRVTPPLSTLQLTEVTSLPVTKVTSPHITQLTSPHITQLTSPHITQLTSPHITQLTSPHSTKVPLPPIPEVNSSHLTGMTLPKLTKLYSLQSTEVLFRRTTELSSTPLSRITPSHSTEVTSVFLGESKMTAEILSKFNTTPSSSATLSSRKLYIVEETTHNITEVSTFSWEMSPALILETSVSMTATSSVLNTETTPYFGFSSSSLIVTIEGQRNGTATDATPPNSAPVLVKPMNSWTANLGQYFEMKIPEDTFSDDEDGPTRNLTLSMYFKEAGDLSRSFWVQLNSTTQMIYGFPLAKDFTALPMKMVLSATDSGGLSAQGDFAITLDALPLKDFSHDFFLTLDMDKHVFMSSPNHLVLLSDKLRRYFGDKSRNTISVLSITEGSVVVSWAKNTLSKTQCQMGAIKRLFEKMVDVNGGVHAEFFSMMLPEFYVLRVGLRYRGVCSPEITEMPEITAAPLTHGMEWYEIVLPALIVVFALMLAVFLGMICFRRFRHRGKSVLRSENLTYSESREPVVFPDELELQDLEGQPSKPTVMDSDLGQDNPGRRSWADERPPPPQYHTPEETAQEDGAIPPVYRIPPTYSTPNQSSVA